MPLDAVCLTALVDELAPQLEGAHIDKVQQPARDLLLLSLYTRQGSRKLLISAGVGMARLHLTSERFENPETPPMFCMLLRKHLVGARIDALTQPENERMVILELTARDELGVETKKRLAVELMGRSSNVVLVDGEGVIIDCLRRADFGEGAYRRLLPGMLYRLPPKPAKPNLLELSGEQLRAAIGAAATDKPGDKRLMDAFSGLSPLIARELASRAERGGDLAAAVEAYAESVMAREFTPVMVFEDGQPRDFSFMRITQYGAAAACEPRGSFSDLLEEFYAGRERAERMRRISHDTVKTVRTLRDRQARKLGQQRAELARTADREELRRRGDLITANLWRAEKGARTLVCEDYYAEGCPEVEIALDPMKTPQQNAAAAYKEYKKAVAAEQHLTKLIAEGEAMLDYLESVLDLLARASSEKEIAELRRELVASGVLRAPKCGGKERRAKPLGPMRFVSSGGYEILVGRSNAQNDELTLKTARRSDIWLHVQKSHGSHVIIRAEDSLPDARTMEEAASLAAYFSEARDSGKTPVDWTRARNVKKPTGALPGKVIYTNYETILAAPDEALTQTLKA